MRNINAIVSDIGLLNYWTNRLAAAAIDWALIWFFMAVFSVRLLNFSFFWAYGVLLVLYFTFFESVFGTTPGKRLFSISLKGNFNVLAVLVRNISKVHLTIFLFELFYSALISTDPRKRFLDSFTGISVDSPSSFLDFKDVSMVPEKDSLEPSYSDMPGKAGMAKKRPLPTWKLYLLRKIVQYFGHK